MPGPRQRISTSVLNSYRPEQYFGNARGRRPEHHTVAGQGSRVPSIASSGICANAVNDPVVMFANVQHEDPATLRPLVISKPDCSLDKCGKALDHSRKPGLSAAFFRIITEAAFFDRASPSDRCVDGFEPYCYEPYYSEPHRNEMMFERNNLSCYVDGPLTGISTEIFETDDLIEPTFPRKLGHGRNARD
jgi:hypothetical protein